MRVGVLSVQGAFAEHERAFADVGAETFEIRQRRDLERPFDALVLPGGESTVQGKLLRDLGLFTPLKERVEGGLPVFATCAGLILLAERLEGDPTVWFGVLPVTVRRNAYGRQLGSFAAIGVRDDAAASEMPPCLGEKPQSERPEMAGAHLRCARNGREDAVPMAFIRAPAIVSVESGVEVLSTHGGAATAVRWRNVFAFAGHPELTDDRRVFRDFCRAAERP